MQQQSMQSPVYHQPQLAYHSPVMYSDPGDAFEALRQRREETIPPPPSMQPLPAAQKSRPFRSITEFKPSGKLVLRV